MEELKLYEGRPADCSGRLEKEIRTYDFLELQIIKRIIPLKMARVQRRPF